MNLSKGSMVTIAGAALGIVSAFLPWYSFELFGVSTTFAPWGTGTGWTMIVLSAMAISFGFWGSKKSSKGFHIGALLMGIFVILVVMANNPSNAPFEGIEAQFGYWLALIAGIVIAVGSVMGMIMMKKK